MAADQRALREPTPLTARSVVASVLIGTHPPVLPTRVLVAAGELFGVSDTATRTALSRMASAGEIAAENGSYRVVSGQLLERQARQDAGRRAERSAWTGAWMLVIIGGGPRSAKERAQRRTDLQRARLGELRDGVWIRPDNLGPTALDALAGNDDLIIGRYQSDTELPVAELFDLDAWQREAGELRRDIVRYTPALEAGDESVLADGFVVAAAVLRLFQRDPLLPDEMLPPEWPGSQLRADYDRFDDAYRALLRAWFRTQRDD